jgi:hypothetical protein
MTAPRFTCRNTKKALAERGPSIHDVETHVRPLAVQIAPEACITMSLKNQRAQGMPGAQCARSLVCEMKKHTSIVTTVTPEHPAFPAQWFTGL